jgi:hypothetical protein
MARDIKLTIQINTLENYEVVATESLNNLSRFNPGMRLYGSKSDLSIYKGLNMQVGSLSIKLLNGNTTLSLTSSIYADNMEPIIDRFKINVTNGNNAEFVVE